MIYLNKKCTNMPCTIERMVDGSWQAFVFADVDMSEQAVFSCEHEAFEHLMEVLARLTKMVALRELEDVGAQDIPTIADFRLVHSDTIVEPPSHDDIVGNVDAASQLLKQFRRVT